ncbi:MAG: lipid-A-disaccharide synthase, partial [Candidatus Dependentiae bacterium]
MTIAAHKAPRKIFVLAGEASGDALGAWYVMQRRRREPHTIASHPRAAGIQFDGIGGPLMTKAGVKLERSYADLQVVGILEIIRHLRRLLRLQREVVQTILDGQYDEVVLIDFPGFNLRVLRDLKKKMPNLNVTFLSPPQLWVWGAWRVKKVALADTVIVLYPFEVEWYKKRGVNAEWWGSPVVQRLQKVMTAVPQKKEKMIAVLPGSRPQELKQLMRYYAPALRVLSHDDPAMTIVFLLAPSLTIEDVRDSLKPYMLGSWGCQVRFVIDEREKYRVMAHCLCALTKPGTNTLELALLGVPAVVVYKTSWLTYWLARLVVKVPSMTLPNLLSGKQMYAELLQGACTPEAIVAQLRALVAEYQEKQQVYAARCHA